MFERLGQFVSRNWGVLLAGWIATLALLWFVAPKWESVLYDGEFHYLPERFPTRQAETLSNKAFSNDRAGSNIVIVARREKGDGLLDEDKAYIDETLVPRLKKALNIASEKEADAADDASPSTSPADAGSKKPPGASQAAAGKTAAPAKASASSLALRSSRASTPGRTRNSANYW